jgi:hypothetical protein
VNTTTCDDSANYVYLSYTTGECITMNTTHFVANCSTGRTTACACFGTMLT